MDKIHLTTDGNDRTPRMPNNDLQLLIKQPKFTWRYYFSGDKTFVIHVYTPPNRFHRWMMKVFLGITWEKIKDEHD